MTKKQLSIALVVMAATALLSAGFAQAFVVKDSLTFAYGYEANSGLPTVEDPASGWTVTPLTGWFTPSGTGLLNYDTGPNAGSGYWFTSAFAGTVDATTSYTVEFAAQITWGIDAVPGLHTIFGNGSEKIWLNVAPDHTAIGAGSSETSVLDSSVNSDALHTYRLAFDATTDKFHVWRDGISIGSNLAPTISGEAIGMSFGDATSVGSGAGSIDYYRWDPTGAYAPEPPAPEPKTPMDSADFAYQYNADEFLPTVEDSGTGKTNWQKVVVGVPDNFSVNGTTGILSYSSIDTDDPNLGGEWFQSTTAVAGSAWAANIGGGTSYTAEFSARVTDDSGDVPGLHTIFDNGSERTYLTIATDHVAIGDGSTEAAVLADALDNSTDFHTYRIAFDAVTDLFEVWRDGESLGEFGTQAATSVKGISFGDSTSKGSATAEIDFMRWDPTGAYAPIPEPSSLVLLSVISGIMLVLRGRRRS
ncbi:MAG: hypothetical protein U9N87_02365 [Planctomycetota bacterium]|nr:hypothetical protein [Planctomycetota bacterium]